MKKLLFAMILISCANQTPKKNFIVEVTYYNGDKDTTSVQCEPEMDCLYINKGDLFSSQNSSALMSGVRRFRIIEIKN